MILNNNLIKLFFNILLFLSLTSYVHGQKETSIWYFGEYAGLDFNSGAPVALTDGQLRTQEGCSSISDFNGNLLFYTDGITVWDKNHDPMPNGTGLNGHPSSTQSGIIVPAPGNPDIYYVFTVDQLEDTNGLQYSIIDLTLNGGLGDVTTKNVALDARVLEKLTAVAHANGTDIWVVSHRMPGNEFIAYLVTPTGVDTTPVVSDIGLPATETRHVGGYIKFSPDGNFVATASSRDNYFQLFRFNNATGIINDFLDFEDFFIDIADGRIMVNYGVEFSSDSSKLYVQATRYYNYPNLGSRIYQFDISDYDRFSIESSATMLVDQPIEIGALQLALDGKIYVTQYEQNYLGAIDNPNVLGFGADYIENAVSLGTGKSRLGLPPFIQTYFIVGLRANNFCLGDSTEFSVDTSSPVTSISWDFGDGTTSGLENPSHVYAAPGNYTVSVTAITSTETKTETKDITIYESPIANTVTDFEICGTETNSIFDLATKDIEVLASQSLTDNTVSYYTTMTDAQNGTNALPKNYTNSNPRETIYARISSKDNQNCYDTTSFDIVLKQAPESGLVTDWMVCDTDMDGLYTFDLSDKDTELLRGQDGSLFDVLYFLSETDADTNSNALPTNYTNGSSPQQIFFRIFNNNYPECYTTGSFMIEVIAGVVANPIADLYACDDDNDGIHTFDLTTKDTEILGMQSPNSFSVRYFSSRSDADAGTNALSGTDYSNRVPYSESIYVRVDNTTNMDCHAITSFRLLVNDTPQTVEVTDWQVCDDDNNGMYDFNLMEKTYEILGSQSNTDFNVSFYETLTDAERAADPIVGIWTNTSRKQKVFYRLENIDIMDCFSTGSFNVIVSNTPKANTIDPLVLCDVDGTGRLTIDLSDKDPEILGNQNAGDYSILYFPTEMDALLNENAFPKETYANIFYNETLYARIQNIEMTDCFEVVDFELIINPLPRIDIEESYVICPDSPELRIDSGAFDTWSWRDGTGRELSDSSSIDIIEIGEYTLTVTQENNGVICENTKSFAVFSSGAPETLEVEIGDFSDKVPIALITTGTGEMEYSLDGENFQNSNRFEVFPGEYTFSVRDIFLCRTLSETVTVLGYEKFFTPNGDGSHEIWNIIGGDRYPDSKVAVYDRYGRLLKQFSPLQIGWDGTFNGRPLPASDYWFRFEYDNGKIFTGHFSLKR